MIVSLDNVPTAWVEARHHIERAMEGSLGEKADDLYRDLLADRAQLWVVEGGAAVSRVFTGRKKVIQIVALGGNGMESWIDGLMDEWKAFARKHGCQAILATGRPGWKKVFPRLGFEVKKITGVCEVSHA